MAPTDLPVAIPPPARLTPEDWAAIWPDPDPAAGDGSEHAEPTGEGPGTTDEAVV